MIYMSKLTELDGNVLGFGIESGEINCLSGNDLVKIIGDTVVLQRKAFEKSGAARFYGENEKKIVIADFCTLHSFSKESFEHENEVKIGNDLTSDICSLFVGSDYAYCAIRNGGIAKVKLTDFSYRIYPTSNASIWEITCFDGILFCGTVDGHLLKIEKEALQIIKDIPLSKKNIKSIRKDGDNLYAASQDMNLYVLDFETLEILTVKRKVHTKMYYIAGFTDRSIVTVSHPSSEISVWNKETLENIRVIKEPLKLSGPAKLSGKILYYASRNFNGIKTTKIEDLAD